MSLTFTIVYQLSYWANISPSLVSDKIKICMMKYVVFPSIKLKD